MLGFVAGGGGDMRVRRVDERRSDQESHRRNPVSRTGQFLPLE